MREAEAAHAEASITTGFWNAGDCGERGEVMDTTDAGVVIANDADAKRCFELLPLVTRKVLQQPGVFCTLSHLSHPSCWRLLHLRCPLSDSLA